jgi:hypothetical protein
MRFLPMICAFEVKAVTPAADPHLHHPGAEHSAGHEVGVLGQPATEGHH